MRRETDIQTYLQTDRQTNMLIMPLCAGRQINNNNKHICTAPQGHDFHDNTVLAYWQQGNRVGLVKKLQTDTRQVWSVMSSSCSDTAHSNMNSSNFSETAS